MVNKFVTADGEIDQLAIQVEFGESGPDEVWAKCTLSDNYKKREFNKCQ